MNVIMKNLFFSFIVVCINNGEIVKVTQRGKAPLCLQMVKFEHG